MQVVILSGIRLGNMFIACCKFEWQQWPLVLATNYYNLKYTPYLNFTIIMIPYTSPVLCMHLKISIIIIATVSCWNCC